MTKYARIDGASVIEVVDLSTPPDEVFHHSLAAAWFPCNEDVQAGYAYVGGVFAPAVPLLADVQAARITSLRLLCQAQLLAGFQSSALGAAHIYPSDETSQRNLSASAVAAMATGAVPVPIWCESAGGAWSFASHTPVQVTAVAADWLAFRVAAQQRLVTLSATISAATSPAAVEAVTW